MNLDPSEDMTYDGKVVTIRKETSKELGVIRASLSAKLGFKPSMSDTVAFLIKFYLDAQEAQSTASEDAQSTASEDAQSTASEDAQEAQSAS